MEAPPSMLARGEARVPELWSPSLPQQEQMQQHHLEAPQAGAASDRLRECLRKFDHFLMMGHNIPDPVPMEATIQIKRLRLPFLSGGTLGFVGIATQVVCAFQGWHILYEGVPQECGKLREWLQLYCVLLTFLPVVQAFALPLVLFWGVIGLRLRRQECEDVSPAVADFAAQTIRFALLSTSLMVVGASLLRRVKNEMRDLQMVYGPAGPVQREVLEQLLEERASVVEAQAECSICLEGNPEALEAPLPWRALRCGHAFHEHCLLEWLERGRRCPLCRQDFQDVGPQQRSPVLPPQPQGPSQTAEALLELRRDAPIRPWRLHARYGGIA